MKKRAIKIIIAFILFILALVVPFENIWINRGIYIISYVIAGYEIVLKAIRNIFRGKVFDENFLMALATIGAFAIGEFPEAVAVMLFYQVGELFQSYAVDKSRKSIASLMDIRPDYANVKRDNKLIKISPDDVKIGEEIVIKPGEKVPLDGIVTDGKSSLDTKALTGESMPRDVKIGDEILSGCINQNGLLTIKVTKEFGESTVSKILDLVENASSKKSKHENFITKFAKYYTPIVVIIALVLAIIPPLVLKDAGFKEWIYRALTFLVVSCPCALVISIPLGFFGGIGDEILSGCINQNGLLTIKVTKEFGESTVSKILDLVENASSKKSKHENFITKFAKYYTPIVVIIALVLAIIPPLVLKDAGFKEWIYRALTFLVVSCPCALVISIPLGFFGGIGGSSKMGVLVKGSNYLEALAKTEVVVFDKTGTLTEGVFEVQKVEPVGISKEELIKLAAHAESYSNHPISMSLKRAYNKDIDEKLISETKELSGLGVIAKVEEKEILIGNDKLMKENNIDYKRM